MVKELVRKRTPPAPTTTVAAVEAELAVLAKRDPALASSSIAMLAIALARDIDNPGTSATARSMSSGKLLEARDWLLRHAPDDEEIDRLDDLAKRREKRIAGRPAA